MIPKASILVSILLSTTTFAQGEEYRGITVAPEHRCSLYYRDLYRHTPSAEKKIVDLMDGAIYSPYTGTCFGSIKETDIEHMVATSEAHDSGLCWADAETRKKFSDDILNLTLASPSVNRQEKKAKDVAEWLPDKNACWFVSRTLEVRRKHGLTIDKKEAAASESVLSKCSSTELVVPACPKITG